jgi:hypothetical protein
VYGYGPDTTLPPMLVIRIAIIRMAVVADEVGGNGAAIWGVILPAWRGACQEVYIHVSSCMDIMLFRARGATDRPAFWPLSVVSGL